MIRRPPRSTRTDTLFPYSTPFRSVVVALNGVAAGAGFQLSLHSDLRIAHAGVRMSQPEINAGIQSVVGSMIMREVIGLARTAEMALSCRLVGAEAAYGYGRLNDKIGRASCRARGCT